MATTPADAPAPAVPRVAESGKWTSSMLEIQEDPIGGALSNEVVGILSDLNLVKASLFEHNC